ncbi:MAG: hypothetical protein B7Y39_18745 [Bdellovibrio sp. 28-41-41]|nr:MAG: hypothetical protein B7Y39_18745 [Bdellovibrio sp. 28-41-41]
MKTLLVSLLSLLAINAFADSQYLDSANLTGCGGRVELRYAENGDLALKFTDGFSASRCPNLRFVDASSNKLIKEYDVKGTSYTLSQKMRESLSSDCRLKAQFDNGLYTTQYIVVKLNWCAPQQVAQKPANPYSYELSGKSNCKLMINGNYSNKNVDDSFCAILNGNKDASVRYEWSNKNNCKIMINDQFQQQMPFAADYFCAVSH